MLEVGKGESVPAALEKVLLTITDMVTDLRKRGVTPPRQVPAGLQGARVLISLYKYHPNLSKDIGSSEIDTVQGLCITCCGADIIARIECELHHVEDLLIAKAVNALGEDYAMHWQSILGERWKEVGRLLSAQPAIARAPNSWIGFG